MLSDVMLSIVMPRVVLLSIVMLSVIILSVVNMSGHNLSVLEVGAVMLSMVVIMQSANTLFVIVVNVLARGRHNKLLLEKHCRHTFDQSCNIFTTKNHFSCWKILPMEHRGFFNVLIIEDLVTATILFYLHIRLMC